MSGKRVKPRQASKGRVPHHQSGKQGSKHQEAKKRRMLKENKRDNHFDFSEE